MVEDQLEGWLSTMHSPGSKESPETIYGPQEVNESVTNAFALGTGGASAAPLRVERTLAEGGMGVVQLAKQKALGRSVAVKTLRGEHDAEALRLLLREAWVTGMLEHPNIVPVHDVRVGDDGEPIIVLKLIEGDSWAQLLHRPEDIEKKFETTKVLDWNLDVLRQVCQALRFAHSKGVIHRDLKPSNVMVGPFGEVYLVDWGIAAGLNEETSAMLPSASDACITGTPCYMAPEMLDGRPQDERTDVYLVGAVLYEILSGRPPHRTDNLQDLLSDIRSSAPALVSDAPAELMRICRKAMHRNPEQRFANLSDFLAALGRFQENRTSQVLLESAAEQFHKLEAEIKDASVDRQELYRRFGGIRFGLKSAIAAFPDNIEAKEELRSANLMMARYEIDNGRPHSAASFLEEDTGEIPSEILEVIREAMATAERDQHELERLRRFSDKKIGVRTRIIMIMFLGLLWVGTSIAGHFTDFWYGEYRPLILGNIGLFAVVSLLCYWARDSLSKTRVNRTMATLALLVIPMQLLLFVGGYLMGLGAKTMVVITPFQWASMMIIMVFLADWRLFPAALVAIAGFLIGAWHPELRFLLATLTNAVFVLNAIVVWKKLAKSKPLSTARPSPSSSSSP